MSAPEADLIAALSAAMLADGAVKAVLGDPVRLYAERSRSAAYPHASWGRSETLARDADDVALIEHRLSLEIWCRDGDPHAITGQLREALRGLDPVLPEPWTLVLLAPAYSDVFATRDRRVKRGLIRLRAVMGCISTSS
ncbi:DUF3168 domain-containing protein [Maricaulis sp.]|uniref:DUF3168 domain-containing protein n=1 Tax=Maricaulis sp. TaxID=1486257 RepID=UPI003A906CE2